MGLADCHDPEPLEEAPNRLAVFPKAQVGLHGRTGRPLTLTQPVVERILSGVTGGLMPRQAALLAGVKPSTWHLWMERAEGEEEPYLTLVDLIEEAKAVAEDRALGIVLEAAQGWEERETTVKIGLDGTETTTRVKERRSWQAGAWYLERTRPERYALRQQIEHSGHVTKTFRLEGVELPDQSETPELGEVEAEVVDLPPQKGQDQGLHEANGHDPNP